MVKNPPANAGDTGSSPGPGRSHIKKKLKKKILSIRIQNSFEINVSFHMFDI